MTVDNSYFLPYYLCDSLKEFLSFTKHFYAKGLDRQLENIAYAFALLLHLMEEEDIAILDV